MAKKDTLEDFIRKARIVHGDKYDYSMINYNGAKKPVEIICPRHGVFTAYPDKHIQGRECPECANEKRKEYAIAQRKSKKQFIEDAKRIHGDKYDYSKVDYQGQRVAVDIICIKHNYLFQKTPHNHIHNKQGCPICSKEGRIKKISLTTENFIEQSQKMHNGKYDYSITNYVNSYTPVDIICPIHGIFQQYPGDHLRGSGCPDCGKLHNNTEQKILSYLREYFGNENVVYQQRLKNSRQRFDYFLPKYNVAIEYNGRQHYEPVSIFGGFEGFERTQQRDKEKYEYCLRNNITIYYLSFVRCDTSAYFSKVFNKLDELIKTIEINNVNSPNTINISTNEIKEMVYEVIKKNKK